jgi:hypothetical protein
VDGAGLLLYVKRRLAESGLTLEAGREATLYDALTEGRDIVKGRLALVAPTLFADAITLELEDADLNQWKLPDASADLIRTDGVYWNSSSLVPQLLTPSAQLNRDDGAYVWVSPRALQLRRGLAVSSVTGGALRVLGVAHGADIDEETEEADVGLPTPCHRAIGQMAALLALTADEESDGSIAERRFEQTMLQLENQYGSFDTNDGMKLRHALLATATNQYGDMLP